MQEGIGFITELRPFKDKYKIVQIYCQSGEIVSGLVRNNSKKDAIYQIGNLVKYNHFKKEKGLGVIDCEGDCLYTAMFFDDRVRYSMVIYFIFLLKSFFKDKDSICKLVDLYFDFFNHLKLNNNITKLEYLNFENKVLQATGLYETIETFNENDVFLHNGVVIENIYYQLNNYKISKDMLMLRGFVVRALYS